MIISNCSTSSTRKNVSLPTQKQGHHKSCKSCFPPKRRWSVWTTIFLFQKRQQDEGNARFQQSLPLEPTFLSAPRSSRIFQIDPWDERYIYIHMFTYIFWLIFMGFSLGEIYQSHGLFGWVFLTGNPVISIIPSWGWICIYSCKEQNHKNNGMITNIKVVIYLWILLEHLPTKISNYQKRLYKKLSDMLQPECWLYKNQLHVIWYQKRLYKISTTRIPTNQLTMFSASNDHPGGSWNWLTTLLPSVQTWGPSCGEEKWANGEQK